MSLFSGCITRGRVAINSWFLSVDCSRILFFFSSIPYLHLYLPLGRLSYVYHLNHLEMFDECMAVASRPPNYEPFV